MSNLDPIEPDVGDPTWFRAPTRREHWIAAALFVGFGAFFLLMFRVCYGWGFRWIILAIGIYSIGYGLRHARDAQLRKHL